jgi:hypothetical protein
MTARLFEILLLIFLIEILLMREFFLIGEKSPRIIVIYPEKVLLLSCAIFEDVKSNIYNSSYLRLLKFKLIL